MITDIIHLLVNLIDSPTFGEYCEGPKKVIIKHVKHCVIILLLLGFLMVVNVYKNDITAMVLKVQKELVEVENVLEYKDVNVGAIIQFGRHQWRVLDVQDNKALIITENLFVQHKYNEDYKGVTWETCSLRKYLNGVFYAGFSKEEQLRIAETRISNPGNLWYGTAGSGDTTDKVFLLSLEEDDKYFGDSRDYQNKNRKNYEGKYPNGEFVHTNDGLYFSNANDSGRIAKHNNAALWWWLRSPGLSSLDVAYTDSNGSVHVRGSDVCHSGGVRPALFIKL